MNSFAHISLRIVCLAISLATGLHAISANRRHLTTHDGLSNMSVLSFMQDRDGYIWAATCDGVDVIENSRIKNFGAGNNGKNEFSGNLVETVRQDSCGVIWVHTNYGLDRFDPQSNRVDYYRNIQGNYLDALSQDGKVAVLLNTDTLLCYDRADETFHAVGKSPWPRGRVKAMRYENDSTLWFVTNDGIARTNAFGNGAPLAFSYEQKVAIRNATMSGETVYYISEDMDLSSFDFLSGQSNTIIHLPDEIQKRGEISSIIRDGNDYVLGFKNNGVVRLKYRSGGFDIEPYDINCGVFALYKDNTQDILWVGTDGEGIYYYTPEPYLFYAQTSTGKSHKISKPVRAIYCDSEGSLWAGTKGDGLYRFRNFDAALKSNVAEHFTYPSSPLPDNDIYALAPSRHPVMWIGAQGHNLSYYSYKDKSLHRLVIPDNDRLQSVHAILEVPTGELYVATLGEGIFCLTLKWENDIPTVSATKEVLYSPGEADANAFFSIDAQNDSILWFGNRGLGAYRYNRLNGRHRRFDLSAGGAPVANDVFDIYAPEGYDTVFCATSLGLMLIRNNGRTIEAAGTHNRAARTVHAILPGFDNDIFVSTNFGIIRYSLPSMASESYASGSDFSVNQFSDGAAFRDPRTGHLYFGGANGFVTIVPVSEESGANSYTPPLLFRSLVTGNEAEDIYRRLDKDGRLVLPYDQNNFSVLFGALDYRQGTHYSYRYRISGTNDQWVDNTSGEVSFTNMSPGKYNLEVCYNNGRDWSEPYTLPIVIRPPFYASTTAYIIYAVLLVGAVIGLLLYTIRVQQRKRDNIVKNMEQKRKEDVYEAKLRFFTNITHELFTPLTLINGSCERMLADSRMSEDNKRFTAVINKNSTRLTELIEELIEFRRIDTEYRKPEIEMTGVSEIVSEQAESFSVLAERKKIALVTDIKPDIEWATDRNGFVTIVNNLVSNALKYTPDAGRIVIGLDVDDNRLRFTVSNTGEGIAPENINKIFDRYKVLERFERLSAAGTIKRNGLGLAVCDGLVKLLGGDIRVESEPGKQTTFTVELPRMAVTRTRPANDNITYSKPVPQALSTEDDLPELPAATPEDAGKPLVYIIDDDREMLWFIADSLRSVCRVKALLNAEEAVQALKIEWPSAIICDVIMDGMNGIDFVRELKSNKSTAHIPVVQLSSLHAEDEKIRSLEAGADVYVTKPFKIEYLRTVVESLMQKQQNLKEYFGSSISDFKKIDGQVMHADDREFMERITGIIEENITNPELSTKYLADALGMSLRNLYRRLDGITDRTPTVLIKEMRFSQAMNMLAHTTLSIDEVIYRAGFNNRGTFFKMVQERYGCTPKQYRANLVAEAKSEIDRN